MSTPSSAPAPAAAASDSGPTTTAPEPPATTTAPAADDTSDSVLTLEVDTGADGGNGVDSDADSAYEGNSTASTSLASSVFNYEYTNGRRYHGYRSGSYLLPNDDEE